MRYEKPLSRSTVRIGLVGLATLAYAVLRYVVLGPVPAEDIPLFVVNKAVSLAAVTLFALSWMPSTAAPYARLYGRCGTWLVFAHCLLSLLLFSVRAFETFLDPSGRLRLNVQFAMLVGIFGVLALAWQHLHPSDRGVKLARGLVLGTAVAHVAFLGSRGWFTPDEWHGGLPPMTLLAASLGLLALTRPLWRASK